MSPMSTDGINLHVDRLISIFSKMIFSAFDLSNWYYQQYFI